MSDAQDNRRVLVVDDTPSIHEDFRKILDTSGGADDRRSSLAEARARFFGGADDDAPAKAKEKGASFELESALQGQEALELVKKGHEEGRPFALAFVDIRMPPGWDGVQTIRELWKVDPRLQCVICTAFSDYSWEETVEALGRSDKLLILKKPFDPVEIRQFASALTEKWNSSEREAVARAAIEAKEAEARAYAASLETANQALKTSKASADRAAQVKQSFLESLTLDVGQNLGDILGELIRNEQSTGLEPTLDRSRQLLETVTRALDLTRLEQGGLELHAGPCDVRTMVGAILERHAREANAKNLVLHGQVAEDVPSTVETDVERLEQVVDQLVANAVHFTSSGSVRLDVTTLPSDSWESVKMRFSVQDTGQGLSADDLGMIFEPFESRDLPGSPAGSGLGLAVARQVGRLLGGELQYQGDTETGSTFALTLDMRRAAGA